MKKDQLLKYAEAGVRNRLADIQAELNDLARDFPHIVKNHDGSMPVVAPVEVKPTRGGGPKRPPGHSREAVRAYLANHPGATTVEIAAAVGLDRGFALKLLREIGATPIGTPKARQPIAWKLKPGRRA